MRPVFLALLSIAAATVGGALAALVRGGEPDASGLVGTAEAVAASRVVRSMVGQRVRVNRAVPEPVEFATGHVAARPVHVGAVSTDPDGCWTGPPLTVRLVDAENGAAVTGGSVRVAAGRRARAIKEHEWRVPRPNGEAFVLDASPLRVGELGPLLFDVQPPDGFFAPTDDDARRRRVEVSPFATSALVTIALRRSIDVRLDVRATSGHRIDRSLRSLSVLLADQLHDVPLRRPYRIAVPYLRGETLVAVAHTGDSWGSESVRLITPTSQLALGLAVPRTRPDAAPGVYRGPVGNVPFCGRETPQSLGSASVDVVAYLFDGSPAAGARVTLSGPGVRSRGAATGEDGRARFRDLPAGRFVLQANAIGMVSSRIECQLVDGARESVRFDEPRGEVAELTVVNHLGERLPYARVHVGNAGLGAGGVQILDHHTGPDGTCRVERMTNEPTRIGVTWAGRTAGATWTPGEPLTIRVPDRPRP